MKAAIKTGKDTRITLAGKTIIIKDCFSTSNARIDKRAAEKIVEQLTNKFNLK